MCFEWQTIASAHYNDITVRNLQTMSQLTNLLARLKSQVDSSNCVTDVMLIDSAVSCLELAVGKMIEGTDDNGIDTTDKIIKVKFLIEQLKLLMTNKHHRSYGPDLTICCYLVNATSASAYQTLLDQNLLTLPSQRTLKKITRRVNDQDGLNSTSYLTLRASILNEQERTVVLMIDEIYIAKRAEFSAGQVIGLTSDGSVASTLLCFAVKSLRCKYIDRKSVV